MNNDKKMKVLNPKVRNLPKKKLVNLKKISVKQAFQLSLNWISHFVSVIKTKISTNFGKNKMKIHN